MLKMAINFDTPLQKLLLLEERIRRTGATLPEDADNKVRFNGIKCHIKEENCLLDIREVAEVIQEKAVTPVPGAQSWIEGVINFHGAMVPVFNLEVFCASNTQVAGPIEFPHGPLVVCRCDKELFALRVDRVAGMKKYQEDEFSGIDGQTASFPELNQFIDALITDGEEQWWRLDVFALMEIMSNRVSAQETP